MFYFAGDASTSRTDDYILYQRVNNGPPDIVARNILAHPSGKPFFEYLIQRTLVSGDTLLTAPNAVIPLIRRPLIAGHQFARTVPITSAPTRSAPCG